MSISLAMHKDYIDALNQIECAYNKLENDELKRKHYYIYIHYLKLMGVNGSYTNLKHVFAEAIDIIDEHPDVYFYYAIGLVNLKDYEGSIHYFNQYFIFFEGILVEQSE